LYLIGLTGNLGSGKSTVRKMLERLSVSGIDADALAHVVMRRGSPTWRAIVDTFGVAVLTFDGRVDRRKLGVRVFADADALQKLETLTHPAVGALTKEWLRQVQTPVAVVEAVKLVEADMHLWCDALWVVTCAPEVQVERVMHARHIRAEDARARLAAQGALDAKLRLAQVIIDNSGDARATRAQVEHAWRAIRPETARDKSTWLFGVPRPEPPLAPPAPTRAESLAEPIPPPVRATAELEVRRARRGDLEALNVALAKRENRAEPLAREETLKRFGERGYRIAIADGRIVALAAWEAENLVATVRETWAESATVAPLALPKLFALIEEDARALLCEVILLLLDAAPTAFVTEQARRCGYAPGQLSALHGLWQQAAQERLQPGEQLWVKRLREELITKPM
jgi:dephospho-CoA kinase